VSGACTLVSLSVKWRDLVQRMSTVVKEEPTFIDHCRGGKEVEKRNLQTAVPSILLVFYVLICFSGKE